MSALTKSASHSSIEKEAPDSPQSDVAVKLDKHGLPLIPQPSLDPSDPLNFPQWLKIAILLQVSFVALLGPFNQAVINPGFVPLSIHFHKSTVVASYQTTIAIAFAGIGSFAWVPLANTYGRRPIFLITLLIAAASSLGSGKAETWSQLLATRVLNGLGTSSFFTLGAAMVSDCFFLHERGRAMGIFTVFLTNSAHIAPIPGGYLAQLVSYKWCYYLPAICDMTMFTVMLFCLPETLYARSLSSTTKYNTKNPIRSRMKLWGLRPEGKTLQAIDFIRPFQMFAYPSVFFSALYYGWAFTLGSILPAVTTATLFKRLYNFTPIKTGLALGLGTLIGSTLGELLGGMVVDRTMYLSRKKRDGEVIPEVRLYGIWLAPILETAGLLIWGFTVQNKTHFIGPTMGFGITCFAIQVMSTVLYSYTADCYKPQMPEIAQVFNFARQSIGMTTGFWAITGGDKIGYQFLGIMLAILQLVTFLPIVWLMFKGKSVREAMGNPTWNTRL